MRYRIAFLLGIPIAGGVLLPAQEVNLPMAARFVKAIATGIESPPKVAAASQDMIDELKKQGVTIDGGGKVAWAANGKEIQTYTGQKKLVLCPSLDLLGQGAAIAIVIEGGKFTVSFSLDNAKKAGVTLPELVIKIGKPYGK